MFLRSKHCCVVPHDGGWWAHASTLTSFPGRRRTFTRKIGKEKEKDQSSTSHPASQSQLRGAPSASSSAKAEKARLAQMYGTPEVATIAAGPSSAKDEKKALERKYNLEVVDSV
jgi:hypothetical protein